ncbi:anti-sigma factor family protein [Tsuneonella mangrovi]|uniref:anti-sigma factor family protein n=1 Tax=Tsuneonella mangrovi TaxID=1982042 RepID=UPI000BA2A594|nr:hypothetical protein [Tsuneonella mangrovi]
MKPTPEELAAFADGELTGARESEVAAMVAADPDLEREVERHRRLREQLGAHFAPIVDQPVPDRLVRAVKGDAMPPAAEVVDFAAARTRREAQHRIPRWTYLVAPAAAAALALAIFVPRGGGPASGYADTRLATALDTQLVADQPADAPTKILLSFEDKGGQYCRVFRSTGQSGIACRSPGGWRLVDTASGSVSPGTQFAQAGEADAKLLARAQEMAKGPALDAEEEQAARADGWQVD